MSVSLFTAFLSLFLIGNSQTWDTLNTINWITSNETLPGKKYDAISIYYNGHFIIFGGRTQQGGYNSRDRTFYIGYTEPKSTSTTQPPLLSANNSFPTYPTKEPTTSEPTTPSPTEFDPPAGPPTPEPTQDYGYKDIYYWKNLSIVDDYSIDYRYDIAEASCESQCHTVGLSEVYFMSSGQNCQEQYLYMLDTESLINDEKFVVERYNLTQYYYNKTYHSYHGGCFYQYSNYDPCVTANPKTFDNDKTIYIFRDKRLLIYNVSEHSGYWSNIEFTSVQWLDEQVEICDDDGYCYYDSVYGPKSQFLDEPSCSFDETGEYIWIAHSWGGLWRYSVNDDEIIDVESYYVDEYGDPIEKNNTSTFVETWDCGCDDCDCSQVKAHYFSSYDSYDSRITPLSWGFLLVTTESRDYIMLPNLTASDSFSPDDNYPKSKSKYIDVVCAGRYHNTEKKWVTANTPIYMEYPANTVIDFGGYTFGTSTYYTYNNGGYNDDGTDSVTYEEEVNKTLSNQIRYYKWLNDYNLAINIPEKILFGDTISFDVYFEPTCDLSYYMNNGWSYSWSALDSNPFVIEVEIKSSDVSIGIDKYMYIINATKLNDNDRNFDANSGVTTYEACYLCEEGFDADDVNDINWADFESILADTTAGCNLCQDGIATSSISASQAGSLYGLTFEMTISPENILFTLDNDNANFTIAECEPGFGTTEGAATIDCNECPFNQFTLQQGLDPCIACSSVSEGMFISFLCRCI